MFVVLSWTAIAYCLDGSGTANYIPKFQDSDTLENSVIYQDGSNIGIGTTSSPSGTLHTVTTHEFYNPIFENVADDGMNHGGINLKTTSNGYNTITYSMGIVMELPLPGKQA